MEAKCKIIFDEPKLTIIKENAQKHIRDDIGWHFYPLGISYLAQRGAAEILILPVLHLALDEASWKHNQMHWLPETQKLGFLWKWECH